jgi:acetyltransferase-like isoleucine patch superfamily enzyme
MKDWFKKVIAPLAYFFQNLLADRNYLQLSENAELDLSAHIHASILSGEIKIGKHAKIHRAELSGKITIGDHSTLWGPQLVVASGVNPIKIGKFCSIARNVTVQEFNHKLNRPSSHFMNQNVLGGSFKEDIDSSGGIDIGNDVWIGTHVVILSGAKIGHGAVIAANSVVTGEIPPYAIAGGSPAKVIKYRFDEDVIKRLQELKWWDWPEEKLKNNKSFFNGELTIDSFEKIV